MLTFTLRRLRASVVLLAPFAKLQRKFLRQVLTIFGGADKAPRLQALLFIRHMAAMLPPPAFELALKVSLPDLHWTYTIPDNLVLLSMKHATCWSHRFINACACRQAPACPFFLAK